MLKHTIYLIICLYLIYYMFSKFILIFFLIVYSNTYALEIFFSVKNTNGGLKESNLLSILDKLKNLLLIIAGFFILDFFCIYFSLQIYIIEYIQNFLLYLLVPILNFIIYLCLQIPMFYIFVPMSIFKFFLFDILIYSIVCMLEVFFKISLKKQIFILVLEYIVFICFSNTWIIPFLLTIVLFFLIECYCIIVKRYYNYDPNDRYVIYTFNHDYDYDYFDYMFDYMFDYKPFTRSEFLYFCIFISLFFIFIIIIIIIS